MESVYGQCCLLKEARASFLALPDNAKSDVIRRIRQIADKPERVGYPLKNRFIGKRQAPEKIPGGAYLITWEMKLVNDKRMPVILMIEPNINSDDPLGPLGEFVYWGG